MWKHSWQALLAKWLKRPKSCVSKFEIGKWYLDVIEFIDMCKAIGVETRVVLGKVPR